MLKHTYKLSELATLLGAECHGDSDCTIEGVATLQSATAQQISFLDNVRYRKYLPATKASAVILIKDELEHCPTNALVSNNPYLAYAKVAVLFDQSLQNKPGVHVSAVLEAGCQIHPSASIGANCVIGPDVWIGESAVIGAGCVIGRGSRIGAHTRLAANVTVYHGIVIGQRTVIHSGVVIGSDGFGFAPDKGTWHKVPQMGSVHIGDDVEIGANTVIDRGALENTIIENGVKLDNLIQIAHNVVVGAHTVIAGCVGIAGSTTIGKHCAIGGKVAIAGHLSITDGVMIAGGSGIAKSITKPGVYSSCLPAEEASSWRKNLARIYQLDDNARRLRELEKIVKEK